MIENKKIWHRNKPNRLSNVEIILFHFDGFRCLKHYYKEYVYKHLKHLFENFFMNGVQFVAKVKSNMKNFLMSIAE